MRIWACLPLVLAMVGCTATTGSAVQPIASDATEGQFSLTPYQWEDEIAEGGAVDIRNAFGDLRVRAAVDRQLLVSGAIQRFAGDDYDIDVTVGDTADGLRIRVVQVALPPEHAAPGTERGTNGRFDGRIDMSLLLPHSVHLAAATTEGLLEVKGFEGTATLASGSGRMVVRTPAALDARSDSGDMEVRFTDTSWSRPSRVTSRTGDIKIILPRKSGLVIEAAAGGELSARLGIPATIEHKRLRATLGDGAHRLTIDSASGNVALHRDGVD